MRAVWTILFLLLIGQCQAVTIEVGRNKQVTTLAQAINMAQDGDMIMLYPGVYQEGTITITKSIRLIGVNYPVLDGQFKYEILIVSGRNIAVRGIHFKNAGYSSMNDFAAIKIIDATNVAIEQNKVTNSYFAIHIGNTTYSAIRNNVLLGTYKAEHLSGNGVHLWKCSNMTIENNSIQGHRDGIYLEFVTKSNVNKNDSRKNVRYGLHFMFSHDDAYVGNTFRDNGAGVAVMYSKRVIMTGNHFEQNWGPSSYGILLKDITDSHINQNSFYRNTMGIHMEGSSRIEIRENIFRENGWAIRVQSSCDDNDFHHNNFLGNSFDMATNGSTMLNRFYQNYWDKYDGYDMDKNGIGDVPHHPVSMYSMIIEQNPNTLMLFRSFAMQLLDKAEKAIPSLTPEELVDNQPLMKSLKL